MSASVGGGGGRGGGVLSVGGGISDDIVDRLCVVVCCFVRTEGCEHETINTCNVIWSHRCGQGRCGPLNCGSAGDMAVLKQSEGAKFKQKMKLGDIAEISGGTRNEAQHSTR